MGERKVAFVNCINEDCHYIHWSGGNDGKQIFDVNKLTACSECGGKIFLLTFMDERFSTVKGVMQIK